MTKKKYTKLEIKLYEDLAKIHSIHNKMSETFKNNILNYARQNEKEMDKWVMKIVYSLVDFKEVLKEIKIPKKFLILNSLEK